MKAAVGKMRSCFSCTSVERYSREVGSPVYLMLHRYIEKNGGDTDGK